MKIMHEISPTQVSFRKSDEGLRGIRQALLEADVSLEVAKEFIEKVKPKALGKEIIRSTSPGDMVVKIVYDELVELGSEYHDAPHPHNLYGWKQQCIGRR